MSDFARSERLKSENWLDVRRKSIEVLRSVFGCYGEGTESSRSFGWTWYTSTVGIYRLRVDRWDLKFSFLNLTNQAMRYDHFLDPVAFFLGKGGPMSADEFLTRIEKLEPYAEIFEDYWYAFGRANEFLLAKNTKKAELWAAFEGLAEIE